MYEICRELAEIVDDGILIADSSLTVLLVNQKMADRLGRSQDELRGAPLSELMDRKQSEKLGKCLSTGSGGTIELSLRPGDERGTSSPIAATAVVSRDGLIVVRSRGFSGLLAGLNQSVLRVIEQWPEGIVLVNKDGTVIFANAVAESMLGFSRESDVGKDLTELLRTEPTARRKFRLVLEDATSGKKTTPLEVTVQVGEDLRHIEIRPIVFRTQDNRTVVAIDLRDVTSLRVAEEELRDRHAFDEAVMSCLFDGVLVTSNEGKVLYYNQSFAAMWGIPDRVLESRDDWKLIDHVLTKLKDPDAFKSRIRHLYGHSVVSKDILELTDGRVIERLSTPLVYSSRTVGRIWTFRDATATVRMAEGLLKSEEFLRGILETLPVGVIIHDGHGVIQFANEVMSRVLSTPVNELLARDILGFVVREDREKMTTCLARGSAPQECLVRMKSRSGETRTFEVRPTEGWMSGTLAGSVIVLNDITEKIAAEMALAESEARHREILDVLPVGVLLSDEKERVQYVNGQICTMLGLKQDDLVGKRLTDLGKGYHQLASTTVRAGNRDQRMEILQGMVSTPMGVRNVVVYTGPYAIRGSKGRIWVVQDITEERRMRSELEEERLTLKTVMDTVNDALIMVDEKGIIHFWNLAAETIFGFGADEAIGAYLPDLIVRPEDRHIFVDGLTYLSKSSDIPTRIRATRIRGVRKDGTTVPIEYTVGTCRTDRGLMFVGVCRDVSQTVANENLVRQAQRELEIYASLMRHDIKGDLGVLANTIELVRLLIQPLPSELADAIGMIEATMSRMNNTLSLLGKPSDRTETDLMKILRETAESVMRSFSNLRIEIQPPTLQCPKIVGSRLLPSVVENVLTNAAVHGVTANRVNVDVRIGDEFVDVFISDNGRGVAPEVKERLFERGVSTRGGGLGLYLSREVVRSVGGDIELVDGCTLGGACFRIRLPILTVEPAHNGP